MKTNTQQRINNILLSSARQGRLNRVIWAINYGANNLCEAYLSSLCAGQIIIAKEIKTLVALLLA